MRQDRSRGICALHGRVDHRCLDTTVIDAIAGGASKKSSCIFQLGPRSDHNEEVHAITSALPAGHGGIGIPATGLAVTLTAANADNCPIRTRSRRAAAGNWTAAVLATLDSATGGAIAFRLPSGPNDDSLY